MQDGCVAMIVALCTLELYLPGSASLKDKRHRLKPMIVRLRREFNVSVAEIDNHDMWQSATVALAAVGTDSGYLHGLIQKAVRWIEAGPFDLQLVDYTTELI